MDRTLEVRLGAQRGRGRGVRRAALRSHTGGLYQPDHGGWAAARRDSRAARTGVGSRVASRRLPEISRSHPAVLLRSRVEVMRRRMIRALKGILAAAVCMMLAGCGAQG